MKFSAAGGASGRNLEPYMRKKDADSLFSAVRGGEVFAKKFKEVLLKNRKACADRQNMRLLKEGGTVAAVVGGLFGRTSARHAVSRKLLDPGKGNARGEGKDVIYVLGLCGPWKKGRVFRSLDCRKG